MSMFEQVWRRRYAARSFEPIAQDRPSHRHTNETNPSADQIPTGWTDIVDQPQPEYCYSNVGATIGRVDATSGGWMQGHVGLV
jgi:hypothetical protein